MNNNIKLPDAQLENIQLQGIFMPQAKDQRDWLLKHLNREEGNFDPVRFVHYTSAEAALNIIDTRRLWLRNAMSMTDYREMEHGYDIYRTFFSDPKSKTRFKEAVDSCHAGTMEDAIGHFDKWWDNIHYNTYIASISEHDDTEDQNGRLSMWRAFGANTARVAIVLSIPWITGAADALNISFSPVAYLSRPEAHKVLDRIVSNINTHRNFLQSVGRQKIVDIIFFMLLLGVASLKHPGFKEEREWRVIYSPKLRPSPLISEKIKVVAGIPQPVYELPFDSSVSPDISSLDIPKIFNRLIIGPTQYPWSLRDAFVAALKARDVQDAEARVIVSDIPIRT